MKIDRSDSTLVFEQVAAEIRRAILEGEAKPGERLPPAKDLAAELGVNTNTVLRALRLLRQVMAIYAGEKGSASGPTRPTSRLSSQISTSR